MPPLLTGRADRKLHRAARRGRLKEPAHISQPAGITCIAIAILVDGLQAFLALFAAISGAASFTLIGIPLSMAGIAFSFLGSLMLAVLAYLGFAFYFLFIARVSFLTGKRAMSRLSALFGSFVFELAPFLNGFPWLTPGVIYIVQTTWQEEAAYEASSPRDEEGKPPARERAPAPERHPGSDNAAPKQNAGRVPGAPIAKEIPKDRRFGV